MGYLWTAWILYIAADKQIRPMDFGTAQGVDAKERGIFYVSGRSEETDQWPYVTLYRIILKIECDVQI